MKRCLVLLTAVWLMLGLAWMAEATADETTILYVHVRENSYLNARHDAATDSAVEMRLYRGDAVTLLGISANWAQIVGGEAGTCWCSVDYLADYLPGKDTPLYTVCSNGRVRVRQSPDGKPVGYVCNGDIVAVRFVMDGWAYIGNGYVMIEYLELSEE